MVKEGLRQISLEPGKKQDQAPESSLEQTRMEFAKEGLAGGHFPRGPREKYAYWSRIKQVIEGLSQGESVEQTSQKLRRSPQWVESQRLRGMERLYDNIPEELRNKYPRETIFPSRAERARQRIEQQESSLVAELQRDDLNKEELKKRMERVGYGFYSRHKELFVLVDALIRAAGHRLTQRTRREPFISLLEQGGGIVVGRYNDPDRKKTIHIVLEQDASDAIEALQTSKELEEYHRPAT